MAPRPFLTAALCLLCVVAMGFIAVNGQSTTTMSSSTGAAAAVTNTTSTTSATSTGPSANGAGNETDGGSTTLGVFAGLAVFALVGYRIWLDYKDRKGQQLMNSVEQPHAGSQL